MSDLLVEPTATNMPSLSEVGRTIQGFVEDGMVPGAVVAWAKADGPIRYQSVGNLGFESSTSVDERSIFRIYSQSKPVTGIAAMMLIEDGILTLDQPISDILPAFADMQVVIGEDLSETRPAIRPITIRHLLTHTAGFGYDGMTLDEIYSKHGIAPGTWSRTPGPGEAETPSSLAEMGERLARLPLATDPGTRFDYSISLDVLGLVIEVASGMPFEAFLKRRLFGPLGMVDTAFSVSPSQIDRLTAMPEHQGDAWGLADDPRNSYYVNPPYASGGGGLLSTAHDYARFAAMLLNEGVLDGVRVLKPETVRLARSNLLPAGIDHVDVPLGQTLSGVGFGAGMSVQIAPGQKTDGFFAWPGEVPTGVFGWPGAAGTACWIDPDRRFFLLFMTQYWPSWINGTLRPDVIAAAYRDLAD